MITVISSDENTISMLEVRDAGVGMREGGREGKEKRLGRRRRGVEEGGAAGIEET